MESGRRSAPWRIWSALGIHLQATLELLAFAALQILQGALQICQGALQIFQGALQN